MEIVININATSADDYKAAIKALMDGASMVGFDIPGLPIETQPRDTKAQQQAEAEELLRKQAVKAKQKAAQAPFAPDPNRGIGDWTPGGGKQPEDVKAVTIDEVQTLGRKMALAGKMDRVAAVLKKYGAERLTAIPAEQLASAYADLEAANNE